MSALSNIPDQAVLPLDAYSLEDLRRASQRADQRFFHVRLSESRDRKSVLAAMAVQFHLPAHFGHNLDALYDCLTDLRPLPEADKPGFVFVLEGLPDSPLFDADERSAVLDVYRDAADFFFDQKTAFRVFYSVNRAASTGKRS